MDYAFLGRNTELDSILLQVEVDQIAKDRNKVSPGKVDQQPSNKSSVPTNTENFNLPAFKPLLKSVNNLSSTMEKGKNNSLSDADNRKMEKILIKLRELKEKYC